MSDIFKYYFFESNDTCPICGKKISFECYKRHGLEFYNYLLDKDVPFHCPTCKEKCRPHNFIFHYHSMTNICIWCRKSWKDLGSTPDNIEHLIQCFREFMKIFIPPKIPSTDENYFRECKKDKKCPICNDFLLNFLHLTLKCNHDFHIACISDWINNYYIQKCPICFTEIHRGQYDFLKRLGYAIEKLDFEHFLSNYFLNLPDEYKNYYLNTLKEFYGQFSAEPLNVSSWYVSYLYPSWTFERFLRRFVYTRDMILRFYGSKEFEDKIKWHFKYFMLGQEQKVDTELLKLNNSCSICLDEFTIEDDIKILFCKHVFHTKCITTWFHQSKNISKFCPLCKQLCHIEKSVIKFSEQL